MYGDPFGKSLCHAWAGSPIYLIGRYFMGICPLEAGYKSFVIEPDFSLFKKVDCQFPVKDGMIDIKWNGSELRIKTTKPGGILKFMGDSIRLESNQEYILPSK
jgi:alpha-L-rhamnosidase